MQLEVPPDGTIFEDEEIKYDEEIDEIVVEENVNKLSGKKRIDETNSSIKFTKIEHEESTEEEEQIARFGNKTVNETNSNEIDCSESDDSSKIDVNFDFTKMNNLLESSHSSANLLESSH